MKQFGQRMGFEEFRPYFEKEKARVSSKELQKFYSDVLQLAFPDLPNAKTKPKMRAALLSYEASHPAKCKLIRSEDQFYGVSRGVDRLEKYVQWVYIPAVKDASTEATESRGSVLGELMGRRVRSQIALDKPIDTLKAKTLKQYEGLLNRNRAALQKLADSLNQKVRQWAHEDASVVIDWQHGDRNVAINSPIAEITATEGSFHGQVARFGHGLQRSLIIALLQELAECDVGGPKLLLGCEEPELYQHPPQARYLSSLLQRLGNQNAQVFVSTHSPYFVSGGSFENIRIVLRVPQSGHAVVRQVTFDAVASAIAKATGNQPIKAGGLAAKIEQEMQGPLSEMFFASVRVFVEGLEDIAYISTYLTLMGKWDQFRSLGCQLVQVEGKSHLIYAIAIAKQFGLPYFVVFDADGDTAPDEATKRTGHRQKHEKDNLAIFSLMGVKGAPAFPGRIVWQRQAAVWPTNIGKAVRAELGGGAVQQIEESVRQKYGINVGGMDKNSVFVGYVMAEAWEKGLKARILERLCREILTYAESENPESIRPRRRSASRGGPVSAKSISSTRRSQK